MDLVFGKEKLFEPPLEVGSNHGLYKEEDGPRGFMNENEGQSERENKKSRGHFQRRRFLQNYLIIITL